MHACTRTCIHRPYVLTHKKHTHERVPTHAHIYTRTTTCIHVATYVCTHHTHIHTHILCTHTLIHTQTLTCKHTNTLGLLLRVCARPKDPGRGNGKSQGGYYMRQCLAPNKKAMECFPSSLGYFSQVRSDPDDAWMVRQASLAQKDPLAILAPEDLPSSQVLPAT